MSAESATHQLFVQICFKKKNKKKQPSETKEGFHKKSWMGKRGNPEQLMKYSVVHVKKQQRAKKVEWWGDDGKKTEQGDTAGTNHCESEVGSDIKQQKGAREGLRS